MLAQVARLSVRALLTGLLAAVASGERFPPGPIFAGAPKQAPARRVGHMSSGFRGLMAPSPQLACFKVILGVFALLSHQPHP